MDIVSKAPSDLQSMKDQTDIQSALMVAKRFPRDMQKVEKAILDSCSSRFMAERAIYSYPRGGQQVEGPSIRMAELLARCYGNIDTDIVPVKETSEQTTYRACCWDLETNTRWSRTFTVKHERHTKRGINKLTDPRDIYEIGANMGARRLRTCILGAIPIHLQEMALEACNKALRAHTVPLEERREAMATAFAQYKVSKEMIANRIGKNFDAANESDILNLGKIYTSLRDGMSKVEDWFNTERPPSLFEQKIKGDISNE